MRGSDDRPFLIHNCENAVQALAKIVVMGQLLTIAKKYRVVMTTHDEIVACVRKSEGSRAFEFMTKVMRTVPTWCSDLPTVSDGGVAENYSK